MAMWPLPDALMRRWDDLGPMVGFRVRRRDRSQDARIEVRLNDELILEMGSVFKVFVLAAFARHVEAGATNWDESLALPAARRVPDSIVTERLPDGHRMSARELAVAMMAVSDNTATQILMDRLPPDSIRNLLREAGLEHTTVLESLVDVYAQANADVTMIPTACRTTASEMVRFSSFVFDDAMFQTADARDQFRDIMTSEDRDQGFAWPGAPTVYRKSGSLAPPPLLAGGLAGRFNYRDKSIVCGFAFNRLTSGADADRVRRSFSACVHDTIVTVANA